MDTVTQGLLGAVAGHAVLGSRLGRRAAVAGAVGGAFADIDPVLRPLADPAFPIEFHRHVTHAFAFLPVGAALATVLLLPFPGFRRRMGLVLLAVLAGYLTHAPLDLCTSYGTLVLWPFSDARPGWDLISVVDPVFTLVLLAGLVVALVRGRRGPCAVALALAVLYLGLGVVQRERGQAAQAALAAARGHEVEHGRVMPTLGNLVVWRSVYVAGGRIHADDLRLAPFGDVGVVVGGSVARHVPDDVARGDEHADRRARIARKLHHFADGFTARMPGRADVVGDMRYSRGPGFQPIWGVRLEPGAPPAWVPMMGDRDGTLAALAAAIFRGQAFVPLEDALDAASR